MRRAIFLTVGSQQGSDFEICIGFFKDLKSKNMK
jgi:hypothetical protein